MMIPTTQQQQRANNSQHDKIENKNLQISVLNQMGKSSEE